MKRWQGWTEKWKINEKKGRNICELKKERQQKDRKKDMKCGMVGGKWINKQKYSFFFFLFIFKFHYSFPFSFVFSFFHPHTFCSFFLVQLPLFFHFFFPFLSFSLCYYFSVLLFFLSLSHIITSLLFIHISISILSFTFFLSLFHSSIHLKIIKSTPKTCK